MTRLIAPLVLLLVALFAAAPPARAEAPRSPEGAEILLQGRLLPPPAETLRWVERLRGFALFDRAFESLEEDLGVDLEQDVLSWIEGTAMAAVVRTGEESPVSRRVRRQDLIRRWNACNSRLWAANAAVQEHVESFNRPPETLEELVPDFVSDAEELQGLRYDRRGKAWTLACVFPEGSDLALESTPPAIDAEGNPTGGSAPEETPMNLAVSLKVTDPALAERKVRELLAKLGAPSAEGVLVLPGPNPMRVDVGGGWLTLTDNGEVLPRVNAALAGRTPVAPGLARMLKTVPADPDFFLYVDVPGLVSHWRATPLEDPALLEALHSVRGAILASYASKDRVLTDTFLAMEAPQGTPLAAFLEGRADNRLALASEIPWSVSYVDVARVDQLWRAANDLSELHPLLKAGLGVVRQGTQSALGLSLEDDLLPATTGEVAVNLELVDVFSAGALEYLDRRSAPRPDEEGGDAEEATGPFGDGLPAPPDPTDMTRLKNVPVTFVVTLRPGAARKRVLARLDERLGPDAVRLPFAGGEIRQRKDRALAYTLRGDHLVVSVGPTLRLMKQMVQGMDGRTPALADLDSYREFRSGLQGRLLLFRHTKTDALYSMLKGALLLLGSEFRPEADHAGLWRDAYAAATVEPGGIRLRGAVFATQQVP